MKGLSIYSIVILSIGYVGFIITVAGGNANGYSWASAILLAPVLVFACIFSARNYRSW